MIRIVLLALLVAFPLSAHAQRLGEQDEVCDVAPPEDALVEALLGLHPAARVRVGCARDGIPLSDGFPVPEALLRADKTGAVGWFYMFQIVAPYDVPPTSEFVCEAEPVDPDSLFAEQSSNARSCSYHDEDERGEWTYDLNLFTVTDESLPDERESVVAGRMVIVLVPREK